MVNNKNLFDYRCWINNAGEYIANAKNFPPVVKVVASLQNFDCRLCEEVISTNVKKNPQYGLLITAIYDKDWIVDTAKKYNNELSDDTIMEAFSTGFIQFGETVFCEVHEVLGNEELGAIKSIEYLPVNQEALKEVLRAEKERRTKQAKTTTVSI